MAAEEQADVPVYKPSPFMKAAAPWPQMLGQSLRAKMGPAPLGTCEWIFSFSLAKAQIIEAASRRFRGG